MAQWQATIAVDRQAGVPLFRQIACAISDDIRRGRFRPGQRLPGTRTLARSIGVQRLTVVAAFDVLAAEGWITTRPARGAFVSPDIPELPGPRRLAGTSERRGVPKRLGVDLGPAPPLAMPYDVPENDLLFAPNRPDVRLIPGDLIGRAYRRAIRSGRGVLLAYRGRGAVIATARMFACDGAPRPFARLGFASLDRDEIAEGVRRLAAARPRRASLA